MLALAADPSAAGLASVAGQDARGDGALVESVPADEGFWVGSGDQRVWAQLSGSGESEVTVQAGQRLVSDAQVVAHDGDFPASVGVDAAEGADQPQQQGHHLVVDRSSLALAG